MQSPNTIIRKCDLSCLSILRPPALPRATCSFSLIRQEKREVFHTHELGVGEEHTALPLLEHAPLLSQSLELRKCKVLNIWSLLRKNIGSSSKWPPVMTEMERILQREIWLRLFLRTSVSECWAPYTANVHPEAAGPGMNGPPWIKVVLQQGPKHEV